MSILKYILFALFLFGLWVTGPLWMNSHSDTESSPINGQIDGQKNERAKLLAAEAAKLKELETKFGPKPYGKYGTGVPSSVYEYWNSTLKYPDSLEEERCSPISASENGWRTVCRYRVKNSSGHLELKQDTFIIKDGIAYK